MVADVQDGRERYEGQGFHDLSRANRMGLAADGVDVKTAQTMLGHSESRLTLDVYAQAVAKLDETAAEAMGARFLPPRRAMDARCRLIRTGSRADGSVPTGEPERRIELLTYALRARTPANGCLTPVHAGCEHPRCSELDAQ